MAMAKEAKDKLIDRLIAAVLTVMVGGIFFQVGDVKKEVRSLRIDVEVIKATNGQLRKDQLAATKSLAKAAEALADVAKKLASE